MKKSNSDEPAASNRLYSLIQMGGTSKEKQEISIAMATPREVVIRTSIWNTETEKRETWDTIVVTNLKALQRLHALLGVAIKTFEQ